MGSKSETIHHLVCRSRGGDNDKRNLKIVPDHKHRAFHLIFSNKLPSEMLVEIIINWCPVNLRRKMWSIAEDKLKEMGILREDE